MHLFGDGDEAADVAQIEHCCRIRDKSAKINIGRTNRRAIETPPASARRTPAREDRAMSKMTPAEMAQALGSGLLSFPVTHFRDDLAFDEGGYRRNLARLAEHKVAG